MNLTIDLQQAVEISESQAEQTIPQTSSVELWVKTALSAAGFNQASAEVTLRIVDIVEGQQLNRVYRHKDKPTNILSFPFEAPPGITCDLLGDLVVCLPVVVSEAAQQQKSVIDHWAHLIVHGTLHLLGYDHIEEQDAEQMEALEVKILSQLGVSDPY